MVSGGHVAIVGAGQAAARTAAALRQAGYAGGVTVIGNETELPYERPPLSKEALFGADAPSAALVFDEAFYRDHGIDLALGQSISELDPANGAVRFYNGTALKADRIVLATGARARVASLPGVDAKRVLSLRSIEDARRLRSAIVSGSRLALIGGGFIGLEIAAGAAKLGCSVTVVEAQPRLIQRAVSPEVSALIKQLHESNGVIVKLSCLVMGARQGQTETELLLSDGSTCVADLIVAGIGAEPNDALARASGLVCSNGIEVDSDCRTSASNVWAVGDVAARFHPSWGTRMRIESWDNAEQHAARAGRAIAASWHPNAQPAKFEQEAPAWFWTDQYDLNLQILGDVTSSEKVVVRRGKGGAATVRFHFRDGTLRGAELLSAGREKAFAKKLVQAGWALAPEKLGDPDLSLKELWNVAQEKAGAQA